MGFGRCLPAAIAAVCLSGPAAAAQAPLRSAVDGRVPHAHGRLLGLAPAGGVPVTGPRRAAVRARTESLHAAVTDTPQPPPTGAPAYCPGGANAAPYPLCYFGGSVLHSNTVHTVFWQPSAAPGGVQGFSPSYAPVINGYFRNVAAAPGANNVYATDTQYFDGAGSAGNLSYFGGSVLDTNAYPSNLGLLGGCPPDLGHLTNYCLTDGQITAELDAVINARGWPRGLGPVYFIYLPQGVNVCAPDVSGPSCSYNVFCAYHSAFAAAGGPPVLYAVEPYAAVPGCDNGQHPNASDADAVLDTTSHEHNEMITDPVGDGWLDLQGNENGDKCSRSYGSPAGATAAGQYNQVIAGGTYFVQSEFSNAAGGCALALAHLPPQADFTVTSRSIAVGRPVSFVATATASGATVTSLVWNFGDRTGASGPAVAHTFAAAGDYLVSLTALDSAGLATVVSHTVRVPSSVSAATLTPLQAFGLSPHQSARTVLRRGLRLTVRCSAACRTTVTASIGHTTLGQATGSLARAGATHVVIRLSAAGRRRLRPGRAARIVLSATAGGVAAPLTKSVRLR